MDSDEEAEEIASDDGDFSVKDRDDDAYSVEFEDDFDTPSPPKAKAAPTTLATTCIFAPLSVRAAANGPC